MLSADILLEYGLEITMKYTKRLRIMLNPESKYRVAQLWELGYELWNILA